MKTTTDMSRSLFFLTSCRYASHEHLQEYQAASRNDYSTSFVPSHQPIVNHDYALLSQRVAQTNENLLYAQAGHDAGTRHPCQISLWNNAAFDACHSGGFNLNTAFFDTPSNHPYDGNGVQSAFPMAPMVPVWDSNNIQNFDQIGMSIPAGAQLYPASYPAMVSAPPAPVPGPTPTTAGRIYCPQCPATFGRGGEYRRHLRIHQAPRYRCPMIDCPKEFSRADKLRDHAKRGHGGCNPLNL